VVRVCRRFHFVACCFFKRRPFVNFAGLDTENPAEFLEEYERYSTDAQVPPEKKLSEAIR
jgi:hypothetical protein